MADRTRRLYLFIDKVYGQAQSPFFLLSHRRNITRKEVNTKMTKKSLTSMIAVGAMFAQLVTPVAASTFEITGNGSESNSTINIDNQQSTGVFQDNNTNVSNNISVTSDTGGNNVNGNTGGDVEVMTGNITAEVAVLNQAGSNHAEVEPCDCDQDLNIKIAGNGESSSNDVTVNNDQEKEYTHSITQNNRVNFDNDVTVNADTGDNNVNDNTGGSTTLHTGNVEILPVQIANLGGINTAKIGGGSGSQSLVDITLSGNGSGSTNSVDLDNDRSIGIFQDNSTRVDNDLTITGKTGRNNMMDNTGEVTSDPYLSTGNVTIGASVINEAGFNVADADCGCVMDLTGSISENGESSTNTVDLDMGDYLAVDQDNRDRLDTDGTVASDTGDNNVNDNTSGAVNAYTGNTETIVDSLNIGSMNLFGSDVQIELPWGDIISL